MESEQEKNHRKRTKRRMDSRILISDYDYEMSVGFIRRWYNKCLNLCIMDMKHSSFKAHPSIFILEPFFLLLQPLDHQFLGVNLLNREGYSQTGDRMKGTVNSIIINKRKEDKNLTDNRL